MKRILFALVALALLVLPLEARKRWIPRISAAAPSFGVVQQVDYHSTASATPQTFTWSSGPVQNNLLVLVCSSDNTVTTPSGFTLAKSNVSAQGQYIFYKVAGAGESTTISISLGGADSLVVSGWELSGMLTSGVADANASNLNGSGTSSSSTGTTATLAQSNEWSVACSCWNATTEGALSVTSWSNSYVQTSTVVSSGSIQNIRQTCSTVSTAATTAQTTTATLSGLTLAGSQGIIATFKKQ